MLHWEGRQRVLGKGASHVALQCPKKATVSSTGRKGRGALHVAAGRHLWRWPVAQLHCDERAQRVRPFALRGESSWRSVRGSALAECAVRSRRNSSAGRFPSSRVQRQRSETRRTRFATPPRCTGTGPRGGFPRCATGGGAPRRTGAPDRAPRVRRAVAGRAGRRHAAHWNVEETNDDGKMHLWRGHGTA